VRTSSNTTSRPVATDREYVQAVNMRWTGIKETHFRRCALRARENNLPGVTVLAPQVTVLSPLPKYPKVAAAGVVW
jgi:hypothetical protein